MSVEIRPASVADRPAIRDLLVAAFDGAVEAGLVEQLALDGDVLLELVAAEDGSIVGHILFSRLIVENGAMNLPAVALAPLAVAPARQRQGVGASLVETAHDALRQRGETLSVVLGDPGYYGRFGYSHDRASAFDCEYQCEALQALAFADAPRAGRLRYAPAFAAL